MGKTIRGNLVALLGSSPAPLGWLFSGTERNKEKECLLDRKKLRKAEKFDSH